MFIKIISALSFALFACAEPNYQAPETPPVTFEKSGAPLTLTWEKFPTESEYGSFLLETTVPDPISVVLWMPSMGHGSSPVKVEALGPGSYRVTQVFFSMGGEWEIRVTQKRADGSEDRANIPVRF